MSRQDSSEQTPLKEENTFASEKENEKVLDFVYHSFVKGGCTQKGARPGFAHALKLSYQLMDRSRLSTTSKTNLNYRFKLSDDIPKITMGFFMAAMDEMTTNACFRVALPCQPGVSVQMQTELAQGVDLTQVVDHEIDILNYVIKQGRTLSHTRTEYREASTQKLLAFSTHVKYMPTGSRIMDLVFTNKYLYGILSRFFLEPVKLPLYEEHGLYDKVIGSHLEFHGVDRATFHCSLEHTNPFGSMHGGCVAMVMETVGLRYAQDMLDETAQLQAMQIDYVAAGRGSLTVVCQLLAQTADVLQCLVQIVRPKDGRLCSEGKLRFARTARTSTQQSRL